MANKITEPDTYQTEPNIAFIGAKCGREPIMAFTDGDITFEFPKDQSKPFYHSAASRAIALFPLLYKPVTDK